MLFITKNGKGFYTVGAMIDYMYKNDLVNLRGTLYYKDEIVKNHVFNKYDLLKSLTY